MKSDGQEKKSYLELKKNLIQRLNRIEGQIRGIKKMLEEERECSRILEQLSSVRASLDSVGLLFVGCALHTRMKSQIESGQPVDVVVTESMKPFLKANFELPEEVEE
jgi:DNA-binding FrmR family transcriptional regulator